jgi:UDP-glucose 4-epimerase
MKKVLIIGAAGFIGRNIMSHLVERGDCHVTAADLTPGSNWKEIESDREKSLRFRSVIADFTEPRAWEQLETIYDEVYMLAAIVGVNRTLKAPSEVIRTNTLLTMNTLQWLSKDSASRLLFSSSSENYAGTSSVGEVAIPTPESVPLCISDIKHPRWTYAITKMHGESAFLHSASVLGYECIVVRYQNIIGPEMGFGHAIPHIVERFVRGDESPFKIYGWNQTRSFCHIDDAVKGTVGAMENKGSAGEIYHIGNQQEITIEELTRHVGELMDYDGDYEAAVTYPGSVERRCPDVSKAAIDFGYKPTVDWKEAVARTVSWYQEYFLSGNSPVSGGFESPEVIMKKMSS